MKNQQLFILLGILAFVLFFFLPFSRPWSISNYPGYTMMNMMFGTMFFGMSFLWILVIVFLVLGILWFSQQLFQQQRRK